MLKLYCLGVFCLFLVICVACNGSGGSDAAVSTTASITSGDLKPVPALRMKWVYDQEENSETSRHILEITQVQDGSWQEVRMTEGVRSSLTTHSFNVIDGKTYIRRSLSTTRQNSFSSPGKRARVELLEMPFNETYLHSIVGTGIFGFFNISNQYESQTGEGITVPAGTFETQHYTFTSNFTSGSSSSLLEKREVWRTDNEGPVQEIVTFSNNDTTTFKLRSFSTNADSEILHIGSQLSGKTITINIPSNIPEDVTAAELREIYLLADQDPACQKASPLDLVLAQVCHIYQRYYLTKANLPSNLDGLETAEAFINQVKTNDEFTFFLSQSELERLVELSQGDRSTIGIVLNATNSSNPISSDNPLTITEVRPLSRAWYDGIQADDILTHINGNAISGNTQEEVIDILPKEEAKAVTLTLTRSGNSVEINTAAEHHLGYLRNGNIAHLIVRQFSDTTGSQVKSDYDKLKEEAGGSLGKVILDLRYNTGGSTTGAKTLVDYLIDNDTPAETNVIYSVSDTTEKFYLGDEFTDNLGNLGSANFVVLVNSTSASASEITTAALKHYGSATIIGKNTFGKGVSQSVYTLVDKSGAAVTSQLLLDPAGSVFHKTGIAPNICFSTDPTSSTSDTQLDAAIEWLNSGSVTGAEDCSTLSKPQAVRPDPWRGMLRANLR